MADPKSSVFAAYHASGDTTLTTLQAQTLRPNPAGAFFLFRIG
ncbi:hypothetical protein [Limnohabitans sp. Rim8]